MQNLINNFIKLDTLDEDQFLILRESLTRIGIANRTSKTLWQSCHILHKRGSYYLVHFKQLMQLDGKYADISNEDYGRLKKIAEMVSAWGLAKIVYTPEFLKEIEPIPCSVISALQKAEWQTVAKHSIGKRR